MSKKQSFFKKHPLIPSIFFILFAWALLYLITTVKGAEASNMNPQLKASLLFENKPDKWRLDFSEKEVRFRPEAKQPVRVFPNVHTQFAQKQAGHLVQVITAQNSSDTIQITLTRFPARLYQVLIAHQGHFFLLFWPRSQKIGLCLNPFAFISYSYV
ncbi:MAG: hypothetical protein HC913_04200 [Microscillaceae bacterium]|nr:hypothetical protein [Microscillaceae bacterium]